MANTTNLNLEEIQLDDNVKTTFISKLNNNNKKIDEAYGYLVEKLKVKTEEETLNDAIEKIKTVDELNATIEQKQTMIDSLTSIGNATASDIVNGKKALVQGIEVVGNAFGTTTTATSDDIIMGKTAYSNNGQLITGTQKANDIETIELSITRNTSNVTESINFNFSKDITNARIIYQAYPSDTEIGSYYSPARYTLLNLDTDYATCSCLYQNSRAYYSYAYKIVKNDAFNISKNGTILTISNTNSLYSLRAYWGNITARVIAIWE